MKRFRDRSATLHNFVVELLFVVVSVIGPFQKPFVPK